MKITENFSVEEMTRTRPTLEYLNKKMSAEARMNLKRLCETLEIVRAKIGGPIVIHSAYRTLVVNTMVGGAKGSAHMRGLAADFHRPNIKHRKLFETIKALGDEGAIRYDQLILYDRHVHLSVDPRFRMQAW